mmetsp:Transcript_57002/g.144695  ORF Transcript_57002/g.144695 Transcript_57002/m.144695 type:complete len:229 (+) Transcript_57002:245-931(+)
MEHAFVVEAVGPADARASGKDPVRLVRDVHAMTSAAARPVAGPVLRGPLEVRVERALELVLGPLLRLEDHPAASSWDDMAVDGLQRCPASAGTQAQGRCAGRTADHLLGVLMESDLACVVDEAAPSRVLPRPHREPELVAGQVPGHRLRACKQLRPGTIGRVHVAVDLFRQRSQDLVRPLVVEASPPLFLSLLTVPEVHGRFVGEGALPRHTRHQPLEASLPQLLLTV